MLFESDMAWMDWSRDVTIGQYETYNDELFGYKAAFEAYINVREIKSRRGWHFWASIAGDRKQPAGRSQYRWPSSGAAAIAW